MSRLSRITRAAAGTVRRALPPALQDVGLAAAHRLTRDVRVMLVRARALEAHGRRDEATDVYRAAVERLDGEPTIANRQSLQFAAQAGLHRHAATDVTDPHFDVEVQAPRTAPRSSAERVAGTFRVTKPFLGLRLRGFVDRSSPEGRDAVGVEVMVDGVGIRPLTLATSGRLAPFDLLIRRPALGAFPQRAALAVHTLLPDGRRGAPLGFGEGDHAVCIVPHGTGTLLSGAASGPAIDKKGRVRRDGAAVRRQQDAYLASYARTNAAFEALFGRPLFLLYGTLLGRYRDGDFIPGDDDFDVGYVSFQTRPEDVKGEAADVMRRLVGAGFEVSVNRRGKPFRVRAPDDGIDLHLDARPVWYQRGRVWAHKQAALELSLDGFSEVERVPFRDVVAAIPTATEAFLRAYYGEGWRVPDPGFSNESTTVPWSVRRTLARVCFGPNEIVALERELEGVEGPGRFASIATHDLYPLEVFERRIGW